MTLTDKIEAAKRLWGILLPHIEAPDDRTFGIWVTTFNERLIDQAFARSGSKFRNYRDNAEPVYRYTSGTLKGMVEREASDAANRAALAVPL